MKEDFAKTKKPQRQTFIGEFPGIWKFSEQPQESNFQ